VIVISSQILDTVDKIILATMFWKITCHRDLDSIIKVVLTVHDYINCIYPQFVTMFVC